MTQELTTEYLDELETRAKAGAAIWRDGDILDLISALRTARAAINRTLDYVADLDRHGSIEHSATFEIQQRLKDRPNG